MIQDNLCVEKLFLDIYRCVFSLRGIPREDLNQKLVLHLCHEFQGQYEEMEHGDNSLYNQDKQLDLFQHLPAYCYEYEFLKCQEGAVCVQIFFAAFLSSNSFQNGTF
jgi:hypothetical protein